MELALNKPSEVIKGLYIGGYKCAENLDELSMLGIKKILICCDDIDSEFPQQITYLYLPVDNEDQERFYDTLNKAYQFISEVDDNQSVMVICHAGVTQSAVVVMSYLMKHLNLTVADARKLLKSKRPSICPTYSYIRMLEDNQSRIS